MYPVRVKRLAYRLDPFCWLSYSGKAVEFKRYIDARRNRSLKTAERIIEIAEPATLKNLEPPMTKSARMSPFKLKLLLHCFASPQFDFSETLAPCARPDGERSRAATIRRYRRELFEDGLIDNFQNDPGTTLVQTTPKGRVYVEALLSLPLPVQREPRWTMPSVQA